MFVRVYIAQSVERHRGIALKTGGTGGGACLRCGYCKFSEMKTHAGEKKIDGYNTVIIARRAKSGE